MRKNILKYSSLVAILFLGMATSCKKDKEPTPEFDKGSLLTNLADEIIIPAVDDFTNKIIALEADYLTFQGDRTAANLDVVRNSWKDAYLSWQNIKIFDFGPIRDNALKGAIGTFPTDTATIIDNINAGSYNLGTAANADAIGLPSLDFLLYRENALSFFVGNDPYTTYGVDVIQKMKTEVTTVQSAWNSYRSTFVSSTGTETTSAFSQLVNEFNRDYELAKNAKVGIPIGKQSLGIQLPEYIEARNSGFSLELLRASVVNLKNVYTGGTGVGFDDYLLHLCHSDINNDAIGKFNTIISLIDNFSGTLEQEMQSNVAGLDELYNAMQSLVVCLKTDMTSAFGVLITYADNDGD